MDLSEYIVEPLWEDGEFTLYRGRHRDPGQTKCPSILMMALKSAHRAHPNLRQIDLRASLRYEFDMVWDVRPIGVVPYDRKPVLVLENPGGESLEALIQQRMEAGQFLQITLLRAFEEIKRLNDLLENEKVNDKELQAQVGLLHHLPVSAWTLKPDGTPDFVNQVWLEYAGQTLDFVRSHPEAWMTAVHPEDRRRASRSFWEGVRSGRNFAIETRSLRAQDGTYRWHLQQAVVLRDAEGKILKFVGTTTDIDDQKKADEALRASETNLREIVDSIPGLVCMMDATGKIQQLNRPLLEYFGKTAEDLSEGKMTDAVHPDDLPEMIKAYTYSVKTGTPYDIEHRFRRFDGVYRWFQVRALPVRNAEDQITGWYVLLTDRDDRKRAERALRASEANLREILDGIPGLVGTWSPSGEAEILSRQFAEFFGRPLDEVKSWATNDIVHPDDLQRVVNGFSRSLSSGKPFHDEHRYRRADGVYRWFNVRAVPARDENGRITRWCALSTDVDDLRNVQEALKASEQKLSLIINTIPTSAWSTRPDGYCDFLSDRWLDYAGFRFEQAVGWNWLAAIHPDDAGGSQRVLAMVPRVGHTRRYGGAYSPF